MSEFHTEVGAYAVDALDPEERAAFEAHLRGCPDCQRELAEFRETAAELTWSVAVPPPPDLRGSVLGAIREVRPLPPEHAPEAGTGVADELSLRRARRRSRLLTLAVAAATVLALALGGWAYTLQQQQRQLVAVARAETELLNAADARVYPVRLEGQQTPVTFVVSRSLNRAMLVGADVPAAGPGRTYQLWTLDQQQAATPDTTFSGGGYTRVFMTGDISDAAFLAVSREPEGGSRQPTEVLAAASIA